MPQETIVSTYPLVIGTKDGLTKTLSTETVNELGNKLRGALITPADNEYDSARKVWNGMIDRKPGLIVRCAGAADVIAAVNFAREQNLLISIRGGGHNVAGAAVMDNSLVIDLSNMRSVHVDPEKRTAQVEGGARLGDVDREAQIFGLATPVGIVSATGVAGLTLHGGLGWLLRKYGPAMDNLLSVDIVTADGQLRKASENENPDLLWAVRGGGGNFGVVTSFEFRLHPVGPRVWLSLPMYPLERAGEVMQAFVDYMAKAPDDLMAIGIFWNAPDIPVVPAQYRNTPVVILAGCYSGPFEKGEEVIAPLRNIGSPIADLTRPIMWLEAQKIFDKDYPEGGLHYWKSIYLDRVDKEVIRALAGHTASRPSPISSLDIWILGGAMGRVNPTATAFYKREVPFLLGIEANWSKREDDKANIAWAEQVFQDMRRFTQGGSYLNFPGFIEQREELLRGAYGPNLSRLQAIKAKFDPGNLFPGAINVAPKAS